jgi:RHS repeat-associated protein
MEPGPVWGDPGGGFGSPFTFTGELLDANDLLYLRARYYNPALGVFTALDPVENLNRYQYVGANPVNFVDSSGMSMENLTRWDTCQQGNRSDCIEISDCYSYIPGIGTREAVLGAAKIKAACLLCDDILTDLDKLVALSDFVAARLSNREDYLEVTTQIILGVSASPFILLSANSFIQSGCTGWGRYSNRSEKPDCLENTGACKTEECKCNTPCPNKTNRYLADTGFNADFRDAHMEGGGNQVYHFWASVAAVGSADEFPGERYWSAGLNYLGLQVGHEGIQGLLNKAGLPFPYGDPGASSQDYYLTEMGISLGGLLAGGDIQPSEVGNWLKTYLGPGGRGRGETPDYRFLESVTGLPYFYGSASPEVRIQILMDPRISTQPTPAEVAKDLLCGKYNPFCD